MSDKHQSFFCTRSLWRALRLFLLAALSVSIFSTASYLMLYEWPLGVETFEDFESGTYENWSIEGDCFGDRPASGQLPGQQPIGGVRGKFLVNTFLGGDGTTCRMVSRPFVIDRPYIHFLIGGAHHPGKTGVNLLVDDAIVRSTTGRNLESLLPESWNVKEFRGREALIEIVDNHTGSWGHIKIDQIMFSNKLSHPWDQPTNEREEIIISLLWGILGTGFLLLSIGGIRGSKSLELSALCLLFAVIIAVLFRTAWMSCDAYITVRTVDNWVSGHGLRFNIAERVQAYTHPLWMLLLSAVYYFTREAFLTPLLLSLTVSIATIFISLRYVASSFHAAFLGGVAFLFSRAFIDYSSSGLENPLSHLLLVLFVIVFLQRETKGQLNICQRQLFCCSLLTGLLALNRMDSVLLVSPPLILLWWQSRSWRNTGVVILGLLPLILWLGFSLVYYGFPLPNTGYAKLGTGVSKYALAEQGMRYFLITMRSDIVVMPIIAIALISALLSRKAFNIALVIGVMLYMVYVVRIGGCFMANRFFSSTFLVSVLMLMRNSYQKRVVLAVWLLLLVILIPHAEFLPISSGNGLGRRDIYRYEHGIIDERAHYFQRTGLTLNWRNRAKSSIGLFYQSPDGNVTQQRVIEYGAIGLRGMREGPGTFIIDPNGLSDPLLARMRATDRWGWRIGHFSRRPPEGYFQSVESNANLIADKDLAIYYDRIRLITRAPLFSRERWGAILRMNLGHYDHLIDCYQG